MADIKFAKMLEREKPLQVTIVGGSLAGLMAGVMLKNLGHNVHILERNSTSLRTDHAAGMRTGPYANEFFDTYDRQPTPYGFDCPGFQFLDAHSNVKGLRSDPLKLTGWNVLYYRLRAMFDGFESPLCPDPPTSLPTDGQTTFDVAKEVTDIYEEGDKICAQVRDSDGKQKTIQSDFVLDAGGAYSRIKAKMMPDIEHPYAGYVAWRGTVPETEVSDLTRSLFDIRFNVFAYPRGYILGYAVPGEKGEIKRGTRLLNYVWYHNLPSSTPEFNRVMTDTAGHTHRNSMPIGKLSPAVWREHLAYASSTLTPAFLDLVENTKQPFISTVREAHASRTVFMSGKLLIIGEAVRLLRPHAGQSANQAALHVLLLRDVLTGAMSVGEWEREVLAAGHAAALQSRMIGGLFMKGRLSYAVGFVKFWGFVAWHKISVSFRRIFGLRG
ncbi:MAG: hypothetical protein M1831_005941 [Alyxoria varia]|nr:MAG: hypothetical protein M1831_005941 [Alyxoria varia]